MYTEWEEDPSESVFVSSEGILAILCLFFQNILVLILPFLRICDFNVYLLC